MNNFIDMRVGDFLDNDNIPSLTRMESHVKGYLDYMIVYVDENENRNSIYRFIFDSEENLTKFILSI